MNTELTKNEQRVKEISEEKNPYSVECNNRHLWSEGYRYAFNDFKFLLERAKGLVGHPATGMSAGVDIACDEWHEHYNKLFS